MEFIYPQEAIKELKRSNINDRVKRILQFLDNEIEIDGVREVLLKFWDILFLLRYVNGSYRPLKKYPGDDVLIKNTVTAYKILIVMRRHFFLADGVMLTKKQEDRSHRTLEEKKKLIRAKVGKFSKLEFDAAYSAYTDRKK